MRGATGSGRGGAREGSVRGGRGVIPPHTPRPAPSLSGCHMLPPVFLQAPASRCYRSVTCSLAKPRGVCHHRRGPERGSDVQEKVTPETLVPPSPSWFTSSERARCAARVDVGRHR